jgi:predicted transcriptional regulator
MGRNASQEQRVLVSAHVDEDARRDLRELAQQHDRSLAAEVRRAIAEHLRREQLAVERR